MNAPAESEQTHPPGTDEQKSARLRQTTIERLAALKGDLGLPSIDATVTSLLDKRRHPDLPTATAELLALLTQIDRGISVLALATTRELELAGRLEQGAIGMNIELGNQLVAALKRVAPPTVGSPSPV